MRQLCNVAWAAQTEWMDEKEFAHFQRQLVADPARGPISRGTGQLLALMGGVGAKRPVKKAGG